MNKKIHLIIMVILIILAGLLIFNSVKEECSITVHGERIPDSNDIFVVCEIHNNKGEIIDTNYGKITIELEIKPTENVQGSWIVENNPVEHGKTIIVSQDDYYTVNAHYDGGFFFKQTNWSGKLNIKNSTQLTFDNVTSPY